MGDTVLVTGARGFVGAHLVPALRAAGYDVLVRGRADADLSVAPPADWPAVRHVVHLAGRTFVPDSWADPTAFYRDNVLGTAHVLEYCRRAGAALVHVSSYVYGAPRQLPIPETHPVQPFNVYAHSKILAEEIVGFYRAHFGVAVTIIRPFNLYGPGQEGRFLVPKVVGQVVDGSCPDITVADDRPRRDYLYVDDLVALLVGALQAPPGGVYNAGSGLSYSVREVAETACALAGVSKPLRITGEARRNEIQDVVADVSRAAAELGWRPRVSLREGLGDTIAWMRQREPAS